MPVPSAAPAPAGVLVLAAFPPASGPGRKYADWGRAFERLGCDCVVRTELAGPEKLARRIAERRWDVLFLRADERSAGALPAVRAARRAGTLVVAEVPTPHRIVAREIARAPLTPRLKARYLARLALAARLWRDADLVVDTAPDGWPWRAVGPRPRVTISNGVDVSRVEPAPGWRSRTAVHLVAAASPAHWNGFDRVVRGLPGAPGARLTLLGEPAAYAGVLGLARELGVADRVAAPGHLSGPAYAEALQAADAGLASLALHRIGARALSPLKTRDYLAAGLPVVVAGEDPGLAGDPPFVLRVPAGDDALDLTAVGAWLAGLRRSTVDASSIRAFAAERFDVVSRARAVLEALEARARRGPARAAPIGRPAPLPRG